MYKIPSFSTPATSNQVFETSPRIRRITHELLRDSSTLQIHNNVLYAGCRKSTYACLLVFTLAGEFKAKRYSPGIDLRFAISNEFLVMITRQPSLMSVYSLESCEISKRVTWKIEPDSDAIYHQISIHHDLLYATATDQHCIHVFSLDGRLITRLGYDPVFTPLQCKLHHPRGLWATSKFIYVGDTDGLHVINKNGRTQEFLSYSNLSSYIVLINHVLYFATYKDHRSELHSFDLL